MENSAEANGITGLWTGLPVWGRVAIVAIPLLVLVSMIAAATGLTGHSESWEYGYRHANDAAKSVSQGWPEGSACRGVAGLATEYVDTTMVYSEIVTGCLAGLNDRG
jgi:hypothetical protein